MTLLIQVLSHFYYYITPCEMVVCDSDGMTGDPISLIGTVQFFSKYC
jgi:hypothetical protein